LVRKAQQAVDRPFHLDGVDLFEESEEHFSEFVRPVDRLDRCGARP
jgi:hypothetical protein